MKRQTFKLTPAVALEHASETLAIDPRALGKAYSLPSDEPGGVEQHAIDGDLDACVGIVEIHGPLTQRATSHLCGYSDGYDAIAARFEEAMCDPDVTTVVMVIDSPGGDVAGLFEAVARMQAVKASQNKRVLAYADEMIASAAYAIATVADEIFLPRSGQVGSVGVMGIHVDETGAAEKAGLKFTVFRSGPRKAEGNPIEPLTDVASEAIQERIDTLAEQFFELVAESRGMSVGDVAKLEGAMFSGQQAVKKGLADGLATKETVMTIKAKTSPKATTTAAPAGATAKAEETKTESADSDEMKAVKAERDKLRAELDKMRAEKTKADDEASDDEDDEEEDDDEEDDDDAPPSSKPGAKAADAKALAKAKAANTKLKIAAIVDQASRDGKLEPAKRDAAISYGKVHGVRGLKAFLEMLPTHAIKGDAKESATGTKLVVLTEADRAVARQLGISDEKMAAGKAEATATKETDR